MKAFVLVVMDVLLIITDHSIAVLKSLVTVAMMTEVVLTKK